jgi:hypothetical protein
MSWTLIDSFPGLEYFPSICFSHYKRTFQANGRYWVFYLDYPFEDLGYFGYSSSVDGVTWSEFISFPYLANIYEKIDVFYDSANNKICYAYLSTTAILYRQGTANSNGTITWDSDEVTVGGIGLRGISLAKDSNGYPWIAFENAEDYDVRIVKATATDGSTWGSSVQLWDDVYEDGPNIPKIIPLTNGKLMCIKSSPLYVNAMSRIYDGVDTWAASVDFGAVIGSYVHKFDAVAISDDVYFFMLVYNINGPKDTFYKYTYGVGWGAEEEVSDFGSDSGQHHKICKMGADHVRVLYTHDPSTICSRDRISGVWGDPVILTETDEGYEIQCPWDCSSKWYMIVLNGSAKLYWADDLKPTMPIEKIFVIDKDNNLFRIDSTTLVEEKVLSVS